MKIDLIAHYEQPFKAHPYTHRAEAHIDLVYGGISRPLGMPHLEQVSVGVGQGRAWR